MAKELTQVAKNIHFSNTGHVPGMMGRGEHSLEVQLPFLQKTLGEFKLVPIVIADQTWKNVENLGNALAKVLKDKKALIVASSDLSHYHSYETAYKLDQSLIDFFTDFEYQKILEKCEKREIEACGYGPIGAMMHACSLMGYKKSKVLKYATSGDVPIGEALASWPDKAIWVGFPGSVYSLGPEATRDFALSFLKEIGKRERIVIAMSTENLVSNENLLALTAVLQQASHPLTIEKIDSFKTSFPE